MTHALHAFFTADGRDAAGRSLTQVLAMDDDALERHHDYIQWLFPLAEPSRAVPGSPVLDAEAIAAIGASPTAQQRLRDAAARMLQFYAQTAHWRQRFDHNHLRITRIIRSLRLLAGDAEADAFKSAIERLAADAPVNAQSRAFWSQA